VLLLEVLKIEAPVNPGDIAGDSIGVNNEEAMHTQATDKATLFLNIAYTYATLCRSIL
jgi:hypothetical protein